MSEILDLLLLEETPDGRRDALAPADPGGLDFRELLAEGLRHRALALTVAIVVSGVGLLGVTRKFKPTFRAEATLYVKPTAPSLAYTGEQWRAESIQGFYGDYVRTLKSMVSERTVVEEAIAELAERGIQWAPESVRTDDLADHLRARLQVSHIRDSYLMTVALEDGVNTVPAEVVNAVTRAFLAARATEERAGAHARLAVLEVERDRLRQALANNVEGIEALSAEAGVAVLDERQNVFYERLIRLQDGVTKVFVDRVRAEGVLEREAARAAELRSTLPEGDLLRLLDEDVAVRDARVMLERAARDAHAATGEMSELHPRRVDALERLRVARDGLAHLEAATRKRIRTRLRLERDEEADRIESMAKSQLESARRAEERMEDVVAEAEADLEVYGGLVERGKVIRAESTRLLAAVERIDSRVEELVVESKAPTRVSLRSPAVTPNRPSKDRRRLMGLLVILAAGTAGVASSLAWERIRCRRPDTDLEADLDAALAIDEREAAD